MRTSESSILGKFRNMSPTRRTTLMIFALFFGCLLVSWVSRGPMRKGVETVPGFLSGGSEHLDNLPEGDLKQQWERVRKMATMTEVPRAVVRGDRLNADKPAVDEGEFERPLIAHAAELTIGTKEFSHSRSALEEILERHHGYVAKLRMVGQPSGGLLTATLRVPSSEFNGTVSDLKTLGSVEREEQSADEVTQQRADLEARMTNAQSTLARLQGMLAKGGKDSNPVEVQRQLAAVNAEIARLEADRVASEHRVIFANVLFSLREQIPAPVESVAAQYRAAAVAGFGDALGSLSAIVLFAIAHGPVILLWVVLLYFPGRWAWRKWHQGVVQESRAAQSV